MAQTRCRQQAVSVLLLSIYVAVVTKIALVNLDTNFAEAFLTLPHKSSGGKITHIKIISRSYTADEEQNKVRNLVDALKGLRRPSRTCQRQSLANLIRQHKANSLVHFVRLYDQWAKPELDFLQFTAVLSVEKNLRPDVIVLWSNVEPRGFYYDLLKNHTYCLNWQRAKLLTTLGGKPVKYIQHVADFTKLNVLNEFGGTVLDFDTIMLNGKAYKKSWRGYECTTGCEYECIKINIAVATCPKPHSKFIELWLANYYKDYRPDEWSYNSNVYSTQLLATNKYDRTLIKLDPTVTQPMFEEKQVWLKPNGVENWRTKSVSHYNWKLDQLRAATNIKNDYDALFMDNTLGEMLRYTYNISRRSDQ